MILPKKILTLKPRVQLRKAADIFHEASVRTMDGRYLSDVLEIVVSSDLVSSRDKDRIRSFFS